MEIRVRRPGRIFGDNITLRVHKRRGSVCAGGGKNLTRAMNEFLAEEICSEPCDRAVVAYYQGMIIGFVRWDVWSGDGEPACHLVGSFVDPAWRGAGLASKMWEEALRAMPKDAMIDVTTTSVAGTALVQRMQRRHPSRIWDPHFHEE